MYSPLVAPPVAPGRWLWFVLGRSCCPRCCPTSCSLRHWPPSLRSSGIWIYTIWLVLGPWLDTWRLNWLMTWPGQDHYKSCQFVVNNRKNPISAGNTQRTPNGFVNLRGKVSPLLWGDF